jgi:hypothetical protein
MEWRLIFGATALDHHGSCAGVIANGDGRVFAKWRSRCRGREVVIRPKACDMLAGLLVGMIVADCWEPGSC